MDTGEGYFKEISEKDLEKQEKELRKLTVAYPNHGGVFKVGEQVELKGSVFKVHAISPKKLILKLVRKL